jgi:hypothetical protein
LKGNEEKNDRECSPSLQMLGRDENIMDGETSPSLKMLKEVEIQWMGSTPHHASHISSKSCYADGECFPSSLLMSTKKAIL